MQGWSDIEANACMGMLILLRIYCDLVPVIFLKETSVSMLASWGSRRNLGKITVLTISTICPSFVVL